MMRRICLILVLFFMGLTALAQVHYKPHVSVGGKAGMTFAKMDFNPSVKQSMIDGILIGGMFIYQEEKLFGLQAELVIEQRGWKENFEEQNATFQYTRRLTYIQLPLLTRITFGGRKLKCVITLGPEISYMIGSKISANFDYNNITSIPDFPIENRTNEQMAMEIKNKFDYGISAGLGAEWAFKRRQAVGIEARFYYGLGNIFPDHKTDVFNASRGISVQATLSYAFRLK
ncbi:MAG: PorT family protein [Bacteroidales bacterium]|nr:PorT family protein [Bacteroidales bacterium]